MKLVTNSNNINTLKLLVSSNVANVSLEMSFMAPAKVSGEGFGSDYTDLLSGQQGDSASAGGGGRETVCPGRRSSVHPQPGWSHGAGGVLAPLGVLWPLPHRAQPPLQAGRPDRAGAADEPPSESRRRSVQTRLPWLQFGAGRHSRLVRHLSRHDGQQGQEISVRPDQFMSMV